MPDKETKTDVILVPGMAFWCNPHSVNRLSGKVQMTLGRLAPKYQKGLKKLGMNVNYDTKNDEDSPDFKGFYINVKAETPVPTKDSAGGDVPRTVLIGNESQVTVALKPKDWLHKESGRSGVKAVWLGLRIDDLVPYDPDRAGRQKAADLFEETQSGGNFVFGDIDDVADDEDEPAAEAKADDKAAELNDDLEDLFEDD